MVARVRGVKFRAVAGEMEASDFVLADDTLCDVSEWLGFKNATDYMLMLPREREEIFKRATY